MDITLCALSKRYGEREVLRALSASFPAGRISCIMGPSGCGKTTLLRLLLGLELPDSGSILGASLPTAAVFQENRLFEDFSALSNVAAVLARRTPRDAIAAQLCRLGLDGALHSPVRSLSGGMQRRVALARALLAPAKLVLLDEPFTGLDVATRQQALLFVQEQSLGKTVLLVTHEQQDASFFQAEVLHLSPLSAP